MKSRMFDMTAATNFEWKYNSNNQTGPGIATWWSAFVDGGHKKLSIPK